jgi:hypothetical protein
LCCLALRREPFGSTRGARPSRMTVRDPASGCCLMRTLLAAALLVALAPGALAVPLCTSPATGYDSPAAIESSERLNDVLAAWSAAAW